MKPRKTALFYLLLISFLLPGKSYSQDFRRGYIISNKGDTATGYVVSPAEIKAAGVCYFKQELDSKPFSLPAKELSEIGFDDKRFIATNFKSPKDTILLAQLMYDAESQLRYVELNTNKFFIIVKPDKSFSLIRYPPVLSSSDIFSGRTPEKKFKEQTDSIFLSPDLLEYQNGVKPDIESFIRLFEQFYNKPSTLDRGFTNIISSELNNGFLINKNNDTIRGFIGNSLTSSIFTKCYFTPSKDENMVPFFPGDIKGFGIDKGHKIFASAKLKIGQRDTIAFARLLLDGTLDLFFYETDGKNNFLIRDSEDKTYNVSYPPELRKDDYLNGLNASKKFNIITDSIFSELNIQVENKIKPSVKSFINILREYHHTADMPFKVVIPERIIEVGPMVGVRFEKYKQNIYNNGFKSYFEPAPYGGFYLKICDSKSRLGFVLGNTISYNSNRYSYKINKENQSVFSQTSITTLAYNADAGLTYNPLKRSFPLSFIDIGGAIRYHINPDYVTLTNEVYDGNAVMSYIDNDIRDSKLFYGGFIRAGITRNLRNNKISVAGGYYYLLSNFSTTIHSFDISLLYTIRFR